MSYARTPSSEWYVYGALRSEQPNPLTGWYLDHWLLVAVLGKKDKEYTVEECKSLTAEQIQQDFDCAGYLADELLGYVAQFVEEVRGEPFYRKRLSQGSQS